MDKSETKPGRPSCLVLSIPDVGRESTEDRASIAPAVVSRIPKDRLSKSGKTAVLFGVFLFYATIGALAANVVVWFFGSPETMNTSTPTQVAADHEPIGSLDLNVRPAIKQQLNSQRVRDPAVSETLRLLFDEKRGSEMIQPDGGQGNRSVAEFPVRARTRY